jgi:drug/metabolite transporter (DMT)-like permease
MKPASRTSALYDLGLVYCAAIWGSTFIVTKLALTHVHPGTMVGIRFLISAFLLLPLALRRPSFSRHMKEGFVLSVFLSLLYLTQTTGLLYTSASNSGFITGLFIIFIPVFLFFARGERPKRLEAVSAGLAVAGLWLLTGGMSGFNLGDGLTLIAAAAYSAHLIITDRYVKAEADTVLLAFHQFWMIAAISFFIAAVMGYPAAVTGARGWWIIIFLAIFPTLSAFYIQMLAQKHSEPFKVGIIFTLEPVFSALFAWTLGGEDFFWIKAAGGFLIVSGMLLGEMAKFRQRRAAAKEVLPV